MTQTLHSLKPNDILFTKDGRKSGNLTVIELTYSPPITTPIVVAISDYGNIIRFTYNLETLRKQFYLKTGKTTPTHKYHDYILDHPEYLIWPIHTSMP